MAKSAKQKASDYKLVRTAAGLGRRDYYLLPETHKHVKELERRDMEKVGLEVRKRGK